MDKCIALTLAVAWISVAAAQTPPTPDPSSSATPGTNNPSRADPSTATPGQLASPASPTNAAPGTGGSDHDTWVPRTRSAAATMEERSQGVIAGTRVESPAGQPVGVVKDVVPDPRTGRTAFVLIANQRGRQTAVPYSVVVPLVHDGRIILDSSRLAAAPAVQDRELQDSSNTTWQSRAKQYWGGERDSQPQGSQR